MASLKKAKSAKNKLIFCFTCNNAFFKMQLFNVLQVFAAFLETWFPKFLSSQLFGDLRQSFENALKVGKN